ncbi:GIY-YIG nuclease family protein [Cryptosporangium sp. NPDC051539]|uniref:GIY-YIG nuclease family protein n=1 Tax=Cryptosporangium sp. NPDC051539 TaxID=3363962 RepID=UPI0037AAE1BD
MSTLRLTLGVLLADRLGIGLRRVGSGKRFTFGKVGESRLTEWLADNARVVWMATADGWKLEERLIQSFGLPLNLDQNRHGSFHQTLSALRAAQKAQARVLPIES